MSPCCLRCGRERGDHDTNLVLNTDEELDSIGAQTIEPGFELSLLDCCETPRPAAYTQLMNDGCLHVGLGAGYVSPNPVEEHRLRYEALSMAVGGSYVIIVPNVRGGSQVMDAGL